MSTYVPPPAIAAATLARSANVNDIPTADATAFGLLPDETIIKTGTVNFGVDTGVVNAYVVTLPYPPASYSSGLTVRFIPLYSNTAASTINVNGLGVKSVRDPTGAALAASLLTIGVPCELCYSAVTGYFHLIGALSPTGPPGPPGGVTSVNASGGSTGLSFSGGPITSSGTLTLAGTLSPVNGGNGVVNDAAATTTRVGAYALTWTLSAATALILPTSGTLMTLTGSEIASNKTFLTPIIRNAKVQADANADTIDLIGRVADNYSHIRWLTNAGAPFANLLGYANAFKFFGSATTASFTIDHDASGVNRLGVVGTATGAAPYFYSTGSDSVVGFAIYSQNGGSIDFAESVAFALRLTPTVASVNYLRMTAALTSAAPVTVAEGTDTNIGRIESTKGTGSFLIQTGGTARTGLEIANAASSVNYLKVTPGATGTGATLEAVGTDGAVDLRLVPKSTGAVKVSGILNLEATGQIKFPATANPSADANTLADYQKGSFTGTATGMTTSPTGTIDYVIIGGNVFLRIAAITGTSNTNAFTITGMPAEARPAATAACIAHITDNGTPAFGTIQIQTSGVIVVNRDAAASAWTTSGTKQINAINVSYSLAA